MPSQVRPVYFAGFAGLIVPAQSSLVTYVFVGMHLFNFQIVHCYTGNQICHYFILPILMISPTSLDARSCSFSISFDFEIIRNQYQVIDEVKMTKVLIIEQLGK